MKGLFGKLAAGAGILLLLGLIEGSFWVLREGLPHGAEPVQAQVETDAPRPETEEPEPAGSDPEFEQEYPVGELILVQDRVDYTSGEMLLEIPRMDFKGPVYAHKVSEELVKSGSDYVGVPQQILSQGAGLFGVSQLPGTNNANVCIAAHRDIEGMEFYDIDKITQGDRMYLTYRGKRYTYEYLESTLSDDFDDWTMIRVREISCLTLQSCDPIGVASHRLFVVAKLVEVQDVPAE